MAALVKTGHCNGRSFVRGQSAKRDEWSEWSARVQSSESEISCAHALVPQQRATCAADIDRAGLDDIAAIGDGERGMGVLLDQQNGQAALLEIADDGKDLVHQARGKPHRRLVEAGDAGLRHYPPA